MTHIIWGTGAAQSFFLVSPWDPHSARDRTRRELGRRKGCITLALQEPRQERALVRLIRTCSVTSENSKALDVTAPPSVAELAEQMKTM